MRSCLAVALAVSLQIAFSVIPTDADKVNSVETVFMSYNDPGTRLQFLNQLQTMWMNELNQFQLVDVPKVEFISEVKNVGTMPGDLGGNPANKVTYRLTGSTALPFKLDTERKAFQEATMAGHMGPIAFGLDGVGTVTDDVVAPVLPPAPVVVKPLGFNKEYFIFLKYSGNADRTKLLNQILTIWKSVFSAQSITATSLKITFSREETTTQTGIMKVWYKISGSGTWDSQSTMTSSLATIKDTVYQNIDQQQLANIFVTLPSVPDVPVAPVATGKSFSYSATIYLQFSRAVEQSQLISQITDIWKSVLAAQNNPAGDLTITVTSDQPTGQTNLHKITYRVTGTADYQTMGYFDMIKTTVYSTIEQQNLRNIFTTLPTAPVLAPVPIAPKTTSKAFNYNSVVYMRFSQSWQTGKLLNQVVQVWKDILRSQGNPSDDLTVALTDDQQTTVNGLHKITYRISGSAAYNNMQYFDTIRDLVYQTINQQPIDNIYTTEAQATATTSDSNISSGNGPKPFTSPASLNLKYSGTWGRTQLLNQILSVWRSVLASMNLNAPDLTIRFISEEPTNQPGVMKVNFEISGTTSYDGLTIFSDVRDKVYQTLTQQPINNVWMTTVTTPIVAPIQTDVNECASPKNPCVVGQCVNTIGSYACSCPTGYTLDNTVPKCIVSDSTRPNGFQYSMALLMTYDLADANSRNKLLGQVLNIWQDILRAYNINPQDVTINVNEEKSTQYGVNTFLVTFTVTAPTVAAVSKDATYNTFVSRLQASPIIGVDFAPLGNGWTDSGKVDWSAEGKSDAGQTEVVTQAPAVPSWMKQPQPAWKPAPQPSWVKPAQPAWKPAQPAWQPGTSAPVQVTTSTTTQRPVVSQTWGQGQGNSQAWGQGQVNVNNIADKIKVDKTFIPSYQVTPTNIYLISDQFRLTANSDADRSSYMDQLDSAWQTAIGNTTEFVQLVLYRDDALPGQNSNTHDLGYVVVIVSSNANLDINPFKATFDRIRPQPPVGLLTFAADLVPSPYAFLVLRDTIPRAYTSNADRDNFLGKLQQLYVEALGKDALTVALAVYDDDVLDRMLDVTSGSTVKDLHQLSYFVLIVSNRIMDSDDVQHRFQQYLISRSVSCVV